MTVIAVGVGVTSAESVLRMVVLVIMVVAMAAATAAATEVVVATTREGSHVGLDTAVAEADHVSILNPTSKENPCLPYLMSKLFLH